MRKCVIITTVNKPTRAILKHINNINYDTIIVGDSKTPQAYNNLSCIFLDINKQHSLYPEISHLIPLNHYSRKNIGYLYAIQNSYDIIYETDDDTEPYDNFYSCVTDYSNKIISDHHKIWVNYYKYFTDTKIWPRGYPLSQINVKDNIIEEFTKNKSSIICGLIDNDPDVDSIFRLVFSNQNIVWNKNKSVLIDNHNIAIFNTQNTFWTDKKLFPCLFIPTTVSFRYCDILRSIITHYILKITEKYLEIISPNVIQNRNQHDLIEDFTDEISMFITNETILDKIKINEYTNMSVVSLIKKIYSQLYDNEIVSNKEITIANSWLSYCEQYL